MHPAAGRFGATLVLALSTAPTRALVAPRVYYATHIREVRAARLCMALGYEPSFEDSFLEELPGVPDQHRHDHDEQERRHRTSLTNSEMLVMRT